MSDVTLYADDCREVLRTMTSASVQCCVTSPPYWGLRNYGVAAQLGLEQTCEEYVIHMVEVFRQVQRVLKDDGTLWLNLGDSYCGAPGGWQGKNGQRATRTFTARIDAKKFGPGLKPKDLVGIPWRVAFALQADGWWLRSDIVWSKPNPMPESVRDRPTRAHEYLFLMTKSAKYYYNAAAIVEPVTGGAHRRGGGVNPKACGKNEQSGRRRPAGFNERWRTKQNASFSAALTQLVETRNARSVWTIAPEPFSGAHFATFPTKLVRPCILAGSRPGDLVLDPFNGAGTTGLVAAQLARRYIGIDINEEYLEMSRARIASARR